LPAVDTVSDPPHGDAIQESPAVDAGYHPPHGDCEDSKVAIFFL